MATGGSVLSYFRSPELILASCNTQPVGGGSGASLARPGHCLARVVGVGGGPRPRVCSMMVEE